MASVVGAIAIAFTANVLNDFLVPKTGKGVTLDSRITSLAASLRDASGDISEIENKIDERRKLVVKLQADAAEAQRLKDLNGPQVEAISQALRGQLEAEHNSDLWRDTIIAALAGVFATKLFDYAGAWIERRRNRVPPPTT